MKELTDILMNQYGRDITKATKFAKDILKDVKITKVSPADSGKLK